MSHLLGGPCVLAWGPEDGLSWGPEDGLAWGPEVSGMGARVDIYQVELLFPPLLPSACNESSRINRCGLSGPVA